MGIVRNVSGLAGLALALTALTGGCMTYEPEADGDLYARLQHEDPTIRAEAIRAAARQKDQQAVAYLVDRLTDTEAEVRLFALTALRKITGRTMGYRYYDAPAERMEAVRRWRRWIEAGRPAGGLVEADPNDQAAVGRMGQTPTEGEAR
jgi:uncharacterized iron-regulated membrane protein